MSTGKKFSKDKLFAKISHSASSGVVGQDEYEVLGEVKLSVATTFTTSGTLTIQGRIYNSNAWQTIGTLTSGADFDTFDIDAYDYVRFNFTVAAGSTGEIAASGFFKASASGSGGGANSFSTVQTDLGTSPVADSSADTLSLTSSDGTIEVEGDSSTDEVDFRLNRVVEGSSASDVPLAVKGQTSQTANLFEVRDNSDTVIMNVAEDGTLTVRDSANATDYSIVRSGVATQGISMSGSSGNRDLRFISDSYSTQISKAGIANSLSTGGFLCNSAGNAQTTMFARRGVADVGMYFPTTSSIGFSADNFRAFEIKTTEVETTLPFKLAEYATGSLPTASSFEGCIVYDSTTNEVKYSDGSTWTAL